MLFFSVTECKAGFTIRNTLDNIPAISSALSADPRASKDSIREERRKRRFSQLPPRMQRKMEKARAKHQKYTGGTGSFKFGLAAIICLVVSLAAFGIACSLLDTPAIILCTALFVLSPLAGIAAIVLGAVGGHHDGRKILARIAKVLGIVELSVAAGIGLMVLLLLLMVGGL